MSREGTLMTLKEYREQYGTKLTLRILRNMVNVGAIQEPLREQDIQVVKAMEKMWCNPEILRPQLMAMKPNQRENLIFTCELPDNWMRHIQTRFFNLRVSEEITPVVIHTKKVIEETARLYPSLKRLYADNPDYVVREVSRIRRKADYQARLYKKGERSSGKKKCPTCKRAFRKSEPHPPQKPTN